MLLIAHRGASGHAPENTLAAFKKAVTLGAALPRTERFAEDPLNDVNAKAEKALYAANTSVWACDAQSPVDALVDIKEQKAEELTKIDLN